jgi:uncharacterized protein YecE (DUF72 family)
VWRIARWPFNQELDPTAQVRRPDPPLLAPVRKECTALTTEILLGTQGWSYPDWVGPFYPPATRQADFLTVYSQVFRTVELDTTFYGVPRPATVEGWRRRTPDDFEFTAKLPQRITHQKRLVDVQPELNEFLDVMKLLGEKLGPLLVQLPPDFRNGPDEFRQVDQFIQLLPPGQLFAIEFRHRSWAKEELLGLLSERRICWCINDLPYLPKRVEVTGDFSYLRWMGDHRRIERFAGTQIDRTGEYDAWAETLRELSAQVTRIYGYFNNHYAGHSPASVREMQRRLDQPVSAPPARGLFD